MSSFLPIALQAVKRAGENIARHFHGNHRVHYKGARHQGIVTNIDLLSEQIIVSAIRRHFPSHRILSEEHIRDTEKKSDYLWVIDPLDGSTNYVQGLPLFSVAVSLMVRGRIVLAAVYQPLLKELFWAKRGEGTFLGRKKIHVTNTRSLQYAFGTLYWTSDTETIERYGLKLVHAFRTTVRKTRIIGGAALTTAYVACGRSDFDVALQPHIWDIAASTLLVNEAGGRATDFSGRSIEQKFTKDLFHGTTFLASNKKLHSSLLRLIPKGFPV